jgi:hypothetical protein
VAEAYMAEHRAAALGHAVHFTLLDLEVVQLTNASEHLGHQDHTLTTNPHDEDIGGSFGGLLACTD